MEQRQQNIVCIMEELQKRKIKKKKEKKMQHSFLQWEKNNGGMGVSMFVTFQSRLTVLPDNV